MYGYAPVYLIGLIVIKEQPHYNLHSAKRSNLKVS